jgi:hypothetical protein
MQPTISTEFNGLRYWKTAGDGYWRRKGSYLHREVYFGTYGNIPHGWHVHHIDNNRDNNRIDNLKAMPGKQHNSGHSKGRGHIQAQYMLKPRSLICVQCGTETIKRNAHARYCSPTCRVKAGVLRVSAQRAARRAAFNAH